jgi:hypothetical protein
MSPAERVVARFVRAKSIGNVVDLARRFENQINSYLAREDELPEVLEAQDRIDELLRDAPGGDEDNLDPEDQRQLENDRRFIAQREYKYIVFPDYSFKALQQLGIKNLFLALIQQYELSPTHLKKVEQYSKFYAKSRLGRKKDAQQALDYFPKLLAQYREQLATVKDILANTKVRGEGVDGVRTLDAGSFKVVNTGGFDQATMEKAARIVKEAEKLLRAKGLGKVCYGEILVSNQIAKKRTLAFYMVDSDEMFIRADLQGHESEALKTVLHELGHRLYFKFLRQWARGIRDIYRTLKDGQQASESDVVEAVLADPNLKPKPGDSITDPKRKVEFVVEAISYRRSVCTVNLARKEDPSSKASVPLLTYLDLKGIKPPEVASTSGGFITPYAGTNYEENFAEMISYLCINELPMNQVDMLTPYLTQL